jgi:hypothetical protein
MWHENMQDTGMETITRAWMYGGLISMAAGRENSSCLVELPRRGRLFSNQYKGSTPYSVASGNDSQTDVSNQVEIACVELGRTTQTDSASKSR